MNFPVLPARRAPLVLIVALVAVVASGCTSSPAVTEPATDDAAPTSLILITPAPADSTALLRETVAAVTDFAERTGATLEVLESADDEAVQPQVDAALATAPDVIIGVGDGLLDEFDPAAASNLGQQFLLLDTSADEPTENLTAATFRDWEALYLTGVEAGLLASGDLGDAADSSAGDGEVLPSGEPVGVITPGDNPLDRAWTVPFTDGYAITAGEDAAEPALAFSGEESVSGEPGEDQASVTAAADDLVAGGVGIVQFVAADEVSLSAASTEAGYAAFGTDEECGAASDDTPLIDSTTKNVTVALDGALTAILAGNAGGVHSYGLAEGGVSLASLDGDDSCLATSSPALQQAVADARDAIAAGTVEVADPTYAG